MTIHMYFFCLLNTIMHKCIFMLFYYIKYFNISPHRVSVFSGKSPPGCVILKMSLCNRFNYSFDGKSSNMVSCLNCVLKHLLCFTEYDFLKITVETQISAIKKRRKSWHLSKDSVVDLINNLTMCDHVGSWSWSHDIQLAPKEIRHSFIPSQVPNCWVCAPGVPHTVMSFS